MGSLSFKAKEVRVLRLVARGSTAVCSIILSIFFETARNETLCPRSCTKHWIFSWLYSNIPTATLANPMAT
jgi:hypothetical protein